MTAPTTVTGAGQFLIRDGWNKPVVAGSVEGYPNRSIEILTDSLHRFARADETETPVAELEELLEHLQGEGFERPAPPRVHSIDRRLPEEVLDAIVQRYEGGESTQAIATAYDIGAASVNRLLRRHGAAVREQAISEDVVKKAVRLYESGLAVHAVASELGVAKTSLLRALKKAGIQLRPQQARRRRAHLADAS